MLLIFIFISSQIEQNVIQHVVYHLLTNYKVSEEVVRYIFYTVLYICARGVFFFNLSVFLSLEWFEKTSYNNTIITRRNT